MFLDYFGIKENPFSNTPDPNYLFMSDRHQEALAHLQYGIHGNSGFVLLTGEVGTGKTTVCRCLVELLPDHVDLALCLNPRVSEVELVAAICDELRIDTARCLADSIKDHMDALNRALLDGHAKGRRAVLIIDEAQNLTYEALEQVRLLTNLETASTKLLQVILIGQPELRQRLAESNLRQLAQRITARYHLDPMTAPETANYIRHRLQVGGLAADLINAGAVAEIHRAAGGIPRLVNSICERALLGAFARGVKRIDKGLALMAAVEVLGPAAPAEARPAASGGWWSGTALAAVTVGGLFAIGFIGPDPIWTLPPPLAAAITDAGTRIGVGGTRAPPPVANTTAEPTPAQSAPSAEPPPAAFETAAEPAPEPAPVVIVAAAETGPTKPSPALTAIERLIAQGLVAGPVSSPPPETPAAAADAAAKVATKVATARQPPPEPAPQAGPGPVTIDNLFRHPGVKGELTGAVIRLFRLWHRTTSVFGALNPCAEAEDQGLRCFQGRATLAELAVIDLPAFIGLNHGTEWRFAVLTRSDGRTATLEIGEHIIDADAKALKTYWSGTFMALWRPLEGVRRTLRPGMSGADVQWLREKLATLVGAGKPGDSVGKANLFDDGLTKQVIAFQNSRNLAGDGIVGTMTQMKLSAALGEPPVPTLGNRP